MKKNVCYFADFGSPNRPYTGGYYFAKCLLSILRELPINLNVFSATYPKIDRGESFVSGSDIQFIELPRGGFGRPLTDLAWVVKLRRILKKMPKQELYVFDQPQTLIGLLPKAPALVMFHGSDFISIKNLSIFNPRTLIYELLWRKPFLNRLNKNFLTKKIGIPLFNSRDTLRRLTEDFRVPSLGLEKYVTYLPIEEDKFRRDKKARQELRQKYRIKNNEVVIMALSNFDPIKRSDRLSLIVEEMVKKPDDYKFKFILVGGGRQSGPIDNLEKSPFFSRTCIRVKEVPHGEVRRYYSMADIAISTSERESFGYFIAEGMSAGLPFVAYRGGAIEELVSHGKTGFVTEKESDFIEYLKILTGNSRLRQEMGNEANQLVKKQFSMPIFKKRFIKILEEEFNF